MSRSNMYAVEADWDVLKVMNEHADEGLPFISLEYDEGYREETMEGLSTIPSYDEIECCNMDGINALEPAAWRHLLSIATEITGLTYGTGGPGVTIHTRDHRDIAVIPATRHKAYRKMNDVERRAFESGMKTDRLTFGKEPIGDLLDAFGTKPEPEDET
jgi:hypothetical protein